MAETVHNSTQSVRSTYRPEIDGMRAIAVFAVIVNHFTPTALPGGFLGVDIFFVISGFVVTASLISALPKATDAQLRYFWHCYLLRFYARRVKRLLPALISCAVITSLIGCLFIEDPSISLRTGIAALIGGANFLLLQQSTDYFGEDAALNLFTQTWSLGVEEQFYFVFPILLVLCCFVSQRSRYRFNRDRSLLYILLATSTLSLIYSCYLWRSGINPK